MQGSWLDHLPSQDKERIRKRLRSPEAYEALREKVKGPQDLEKEMHRSEQLAELHFALEMEPGLREALKSQVQDDIRDHGMQEVLHVGPLSSEGLRSIEQGQFAMKVDAHPQTHEDAIVAVPEGNVQEKAPVKPAFSDRYVGQFVKDVG